MSKELTEQWKQDKLTDGFYYVKMPNGDFITLGWYELKDYKFAKDADKIKVLSPVPTYAQVAGNRKMVEDLKQQLKEAEDVIRFYTNTDGLTEEEKQMTAEKYHLLYGLKANDYLEKYGVDK